MKIKSNILSFAIIFSILISACSNTSTHQSMSMDTSSGNSNSQLVSQNQPALNEISRLTSLAGKDSIKVEDLSKLEGMIKDDGKAMDEFNEIKTMVKYKEFEHAAHGLSFLDGYLRTGKKVICPGHELSHYYIFKKHGEGDMANDSLNAAKDEMSQWIPKARNYNNKYPSGENFDIIVKVLNDHIKDIESGKTTITNEEMDYLDNKASICVQE